MALISFSEDTNWKKAGWVLRQILEDVLSQYPGDSAMAGEFDLATQRSWMVVDGLEPQLATRITDAIKHTVTAILSGQMRSGIYEKPYGDPKTVEQYHEALRELIRLIPPGAGGRVAHSSPPLA